MIFACQFTSLCFEFFSYRNTAKTGQERAKGVNTIVIIRLIICFLYPLKNYKLNVIQVERLVRHSSSTKETHWSLQVLTEETKCNPTSFFLISIILYFRSYFIFIFSVSKYCIYAFCTLSDQFLQYFYILSSFDWSRSSLIQRRASFDRIRFCSGLNLGKLFFSVR